MDTKKSVTFDEMKNELKTTLMARHGLGPEHDDAFIDSFMDKLGANVVHELQQWHEPRPASPPVRPSWTLTPERRVIIALASMLVIVAIFVVTVIAASHFYSPHRLHRLMIWSLCSATAVFLVNLALNVRLYLKVKR